MSATNRSDVRQADDFYRTQPWVVHAIVPHLPRTGLVLDVGCGDGAILESLVAAGYDRNQMAGVELHPERAAKARAKGFLVSEGDYRTWGAHPRQFALAIGNPPYSLALDFALRAVPLAAQVNATVALLLRLGWLASKTRQPFHTKYPSDVYVLPRRPEFVASIKCKERCGYEEILQIEAPRPAVCPQCGKPVTVSTTDASEYAWFVWGPGRGHRWFLLEDNEPVASVLNDTLPASVTTVESTPKEPESYEPPMRLGPALPDHIQAGLKLGETLEVLAPLGEILSKAAPDPDAAGDAVVPAEASDADTDFDPASFHTEPYGKSGFFDPATGEVFDLLPSVADQRRAAGQPLEPVGAAPVPPPVAPPALPPPPAVEETGFLGPAPSKPKRPRAQPSPAQTFAHPPPKTPAAERTLPLPGIPAPLPPQATGPLPSHVVPELGTHPAIVPEIDRAGILLRAVRDGIVGADVPADTAWILLQYKAPAGWMRKVKEELADAPSVAAIPAAFPEPENLGTLVTALAVRGISVSLMVVASWQPDVRRQALAFTRGEVPSFVPPPAPAAHGV